MKAEAYRKSSLPCWLDFRVCYQRSKDNKDTIRNQEANERA